MLNALSTYQSWTICHWPFIHRKSSMSLRIPPNSPNLTNQQNFYFYSSHLNRYWPVIDDALRAAAIDNKVSVKLLISWWNHSRPAEDYFLRSLSELSDSYPGVDIQVVSHHYSPPPSKPCLQTISNLNLFAETIHCASYRRSNENPIRSCQSQQIHGNWSCRLYWHVQLVRRLFHWYGRHWIRYWRNRTRNK